MTALTKLTVVARFSLRNLSGHSMHQTEPPCPDITTATSLLPSALKSGVEVWKTRSQQPALGTATIPPHDPSSRTRTDELSEAPDRQAAGPRHELQQPDPLLVVHLLHHLRGQRARSGTPITPTPRWARAPSCSAAPAPFTPRSRLALPAPAPRRGWRRWGSPARTTGSACCSWCSAGRWCSSASRSCRSPACRTASARDRAQSAAGQKQGPAPTHHSTDCFGAGLRQAQAPAQGTGGIPRL